MKEENNNRQIKIGIILSYLNMGIGNLIPLFYTPIMLSLLGQNEYGLYKIANSTTSYLSLVSFGMGAAVTRYLIKANIEGGKEAEEKTFGLFHLIFQTIAIITLVIGIILAFKLDVFYDNSLNDIEMKTMKTLVILLVLNMAINFSATSYNAVITTHERFVFIQSCNILLTIGGPIANLIVLFLGYKSVGMAISSLALNVMIRLVYVLYVQKMLQLRPKFNNMPFSIIKEVLKFSIWIFVANISSQLFSATDTVIIGMVPALATVGAAVYSIGYTFPNIMFSLAQVVPGVFMPTTNKMVFGGSTDEELTDLMIKTGRMQGIIVALVCSGFIAFGKSFIEFYVGPGYEDAYWVAVIIMIPNCIPLVQSVGHSILQAKNMHKFRSIVYLVIAILNAVFTWFLVRRWGIIGAAIPTGLTYILGNGLILNWYYWKKVRLNIPRFWKNIIPIFGVASILSILTLAIGHWIDFYVLWKMFIGIVVYTICYALLLWKYVLVEEEKDNLTMIIRRFLKNRR